MPWRTHSSSRVTASAVLFLVACSTTTALDDRSDQEATARQDNMDAPGLVEPTYEPIRQDHSIDRLRRLDDDDPTQRRRAAAEIYASSTSVLTAEMDDRCYSISVQPKFGCAESADFCKSTTGHHVGAGDDRIISYAYPADPPEIFQSAGIADYDPDRQPAHPTFIVDGLPVGPGSGQFPGGIPLIEERVPPDPELLCGIRPGVTTSYPPTRENEGPELSQLIAMSISLVANALSRGHSTSCTRAVRNRYQRLQCDVIFINPCRNEAFIGCEGKNRQSADSHQVNLPTGEILHVRWSESRTDHSAIWSVEIEDVH